MPTVYQIKDQEQLHFITLQLCFLAVEVLTRKWKTNSSVRDLH